MAYTGGFRGVGDPSEGPAQPRDYPHRRWSIIHRLRNDPHVCILAAPVKFCFHNNGPGLDLWCRYGPCRSRGNVHWMGRNSLVSAGVYWRYLPVHKRCTGDGSEP